jgi:hypothetical protein
MEVSSEETGSSPLATLAGVREASSRATEVEPGLSFVRLSAAEGHRRFLEQVLPIRLMADAAMRSRALRRFLEAGPALREMGVLYHLLDLLQRTRRDKSFEYPLCVVDLPATGHALALASLPQVLLSVLPGGPIGRTVRQGLDFLQDPARCAALLVTLPEPLPVSETLELATELSRHRIPLAGAVLNRVPENPFAPEGRAALARLLDTHGPHRGHRALGRLDRAHAAESRLATHLGAPLLRVPELPLTGRELVARLAEVLALSTRPPARTSGVSS